MRTTQPTDNSTRTAKPRFSTAGFDCVLPPEARSELVPPGRLNPALSWLREVALRVEVDDPLEEGLKPNEITEICETMT
jgi:hypothetical protein